MKRNSMKMATTAAAAVGIGLLAGCSTFQKPPQVVERTDYDRPSVAQVEQGYDTFGRKWSDQSAASPVIQKAPEIKTGIVTMQKQVPAMVGLNDSYSSDIMLSATEQAGNVVLTDRIPEGAEYVKSDPEATRDGNLLTWRFPSMAKGEMKTVRTMYKATKEGQLSSCATVSAEPQTCVATLVGKPIIALTKTGPERALLGLDIVYTNTVSNTGNMPARDVVVTDKVPEGLAHASLQKELTFKIGNLAPNESKTIPVTLKTMQRGTVCNDSIASAGNAPNAAAQACTVIYQPGLAVFKTGDAEQFLNKKAGYTIVVTNTGDSTLKDVIVTDTAPGQTTFITADGASIDRQTATWTVSQLQPGEAKTFKAVLTSKTAGTYRNEVAATAMGLHEVAQVSTLWRGLGGLAVEVVDDNDPVQIGETTTYTIRVTNQGTADITNIGLNAKQSDELEPITAVGLTTEGQSMTVSSIPKLAPGESVVYKITSKGVRAGDARLKVTLTANELSSAVIEEESTHVY